MSEPDTFEDDLLYAMSRTGEAFRSERADLAAGGLDLGRRRWRRRSAAAVVSGAAALALVATGAFYLSGATGGSSAAPAEAAAAPATGTAPATATPAATPTATKAAAPAAPVTDKEMLAAFQSLLPKGEVTDAKGEGTEKSTTPYAQLVFDDGQGKSLMSVSVQKFYKGQEQQRTCPTDLKLANLDSCSVTTLADGSTLMLSQGYEYPDHRATTKEWWATVSRPDGGQVSFNEWNAAQEKGAPDSRPNPPITLEQAKAIVTDKVWDKAVAAVRYNGIDPESSEVGLPLSQRKTILAGLLPAGVTMTQVSGTDVVADIRLSQGGSTGSLMLRVQKLVLQEGDPTGEIFKDATVLPDGTKLLLRGPGTSAPKGPLAADILRPDGVRVTASQGPTGTALLSLDQLKAIAASPEWKVKK
ncbi:hypothetical protein PUR71_21925 [Streptomyces sp. SP17BM10]|uniref:hypothetical protein n=1 Tax=Streptomyces sp. SP17BM10 TaxID=3002530 RepID=UPI002E75D930|nr:hypothetical protein [Streptomyces sp. SP17BM10]MEE1785543.1 hypothetical protein [Streptomyces sp. SP17BM10]